MANKMSRNQKLTFLMSGFAIVISIVSPFVSYYFLDPQLQAFKNRGKLEISDFDVGKGDMWDEKAHSFSSDFSPMQDWSVELSNLGNLPAKDPLVVLEYSKTFRNDIHVTCDPPSPFEIKQQGTQLLVTLRKPLPSQEKIRVHVDQMPLTVWASNEYGETDKITTYFGLFLSLKELMAAGHENDLPVATPTPLSKKKTGEK